MSILFTDDEMKAEKTSIGPVTQKQRWQSPMQMWTDVGSVLGRTTPLP